MLALGIVESFLSLVERRGQDECWPWLGARTGEGCGFLTVGKGADRMDVLAPRIAFALDRGKQPGGLVAQSCRDPGCCNPRHLYEDSTEPGRRGTGMTGVRGTMHPRALYDDTMRDRALEMHGDRWNASKIARVLGCHRITVARWIEDHELRSGARVVPSATYLRSRPSERV